MFYNSKPKSRSGDGQHISSYYCCQIAELKCAIGNTEGNEMTVHRLTTGADAVLFQSLSQEVTRARKASGLSCRAAARELGISASTLWRIENGKRLRPGPEILGKLAELDGLDYRSLMFLVGHYPQCDEIDEIAWHFDLDSYDQRQIEKLRPRVKHALRSLWAYSRARRRGPHTQKEKR